MGSNNEVLPNLLYNFSFTILMFNLYLTKGSRTSGPTTKGGGGKARTTIGKRTFFEALKAKN